MRRRRASVWVIAAFCAALVPAAVGWSEVRLSPDQMRGAAAESLRLNQPAQARAYADALLARDPADLTARLIRARALRDLGAYAAAETEARRAWGEATTPADRYASALIVAQVLASDGKRTRAQFWLRRAAHHAPSDALAARAARDFSYVRQRNRWQTTLAVTLAPNSNINNGSARDSSFLNYRLSEILFGEPVEYALSGSARALSGLEFGAAVQTRYRFAETAVTAHDLKAGLSYRSFALSDSARRQSPEMSGSDFAFGTVSVGYGYRQINADRRGEFTGDLEAGQSWYGGSRHAAYLRAALSQSLLMDRDRRLRFGVELEHQEGQATADQNRLSLSLSQTRRLATGHQGYLAVQAARAQSDSFEHDFTEVEVRGGLRLARPILGTVLQVGLGAELRRFDRSAHSPSGREDLRVFADVTAIFENIDYYGFNPSVTVSASSTDSNIGLFDVDRFGISLGIRSAF